MAANTLLQYSGIGKVYFVAATWYTTQEMKNTDLEHSIQTQNDCQN